METSKAYQLNIGEIDDLVNAIQVMAKQLEAKMLLGQVLRIRA